MAAGSEEASIRIVERFMKRLDPAPAEAQGSSRGKEEGPIVTMVKAWTAKDNRHFPYATVRWPSLSDPVKLRVTAEQLARIKGRVEVSLLVGPGALGFNWFAGVAQ